MKFHSFPYKIEKTCATIAQVSFCLASYNIIVYHKH